MGMRFYISNESYPELRAVTPGWARHVAWWRAFGCAVRSGTFWLFVSVTAVATLAAAILTAWMLASTPLAERVGFVLPLFGALTAGSAVQIVLTLSWGGEMMRRHLRRGNAVCAQTCPGCGHLLTPQIASGAYPILCPECGGRSGRECFQEPFSTALQASSRSTMR